MERALLAFKRYYEIQDAVRMQVETRPLAVQTPDQILKPRMIVWTAGAATGLAI